jgi:membrane protease YdiL (CAAX protease family)
MSVESHGKSAVIPQQTQPEASNEVEGAPENIMVTSLVVVMVLLLQVLEAPLLVRGFHNSIVQVVQFRRGSNSGAAAPKSSSISRPFLNLHDPKASPPRNHPALFANRGRKLPSPPPSPVPLQGPNWNIVNSLLVGEFIVFGVGALLALLLACDPLIGFSAAQNDIFLGVATGCVLLAASTALDNSGIEAFTNISQDTKLFVASTLGAYSPPMKLITLVVSGALALSAAFAEEFLFRGVLLQYGALSGFEPLSALFLSSLVFGLAHSPVPGASALLESLYGAAFGMVVSVAIGK